MPNRFFETLAQDLRYGFRTLLQRSPGFTFIAVAALTLGIGFNTAMFSVLNTVLLRPLPYRDSGSLMMVWENNRVRNRPRNVIAPADYLDWQARNHVFESMSPVAGVSDTLTGTGEPEEIDGQSVNAAFFSLLGVHPLIGRNFTAEEDRPGGPQVVIISQQLWSRKFGGDPAILGRSIVLDGKSQTVIGVMSATFKSVGATPDLILPVRLDPARDYRARSGRYMRSVARLKPGVTQAQAQAEMDRIASSLELEHPAFNTGWGVTLVPLNDQITGNARPALFILMGAVAFVLLIACANVANLLLARATSRARELALRVSLGASPGRIFRQLVSESLLLATAGCLFGGLLAIWAVGSLRRLAPSGIPRVDELSVDWRVLAFTASTSLLAGLLFGLVPAFQAATASVSEAIKAGRGNSAGSRQRRSGGFFIAAETALAFILLAGAGLMIRTLVQLQSVNPGFDASHVLTMTATLPNSKYREPGKQVAFFDHVIEELRRLPEVTAASCISGLPFAGMASATNFSVVGRPEPEPGKSPVTEVRVVDPDYFHTLRIPLLRGRNFDSRDYRTGAPRTFIVNQELARSLFPNEDPLGKSLIVGMGDSIPGEIVGITGNVLHYSLDDEIRPMVYYSNPQLPMGYATFVIRTAADPMSLARQAVAVIHSIDRDQPVTDIKTMEDRLASSTAKTRYTMLLLAMFAVVAMALAAAGIYGVTSYTVARRTQEIGIRMALGAQREDVWRLVIVQGMAPVMAGMAAGLAGALALTRLLASLLFGVGARDAITYAAVAGFLAAVAIAACLIPARRATKIDPATALTYE